MDIIKPSSLDVNLEEYISKSLLNHLYEGIYFVDRDRQIKFWNVGAEKITGYKSDEVIGLYCHDNILAHKDENGINLCNDFCPLVDAINNDCYKDARVYLKHKNGYRVPVWVHISPIKNDLDEIVGAVEVFVDDSDYEKIKQLNKLLEKLSEIDELTQLPNRRYFQQEVVKEINRANRYNNTLALLMLDLDHFKHINDTSGHLAGDEALKFLSKLLMNSVRDSDFLCRYGGEEFLILLPQTNSLNAYKASEKIRENVQNASFNFENKTIPITVSIGIAIKTPELDINYEKFIAMADQALYKAKESGRNKSIFFEEQ